MRYIDKAHAQVCKTSRTQIERQVSAMIAGDVDGTFRDLLSTNYGINNPNNINKAGKNINLLLGKLNLGTNTEICKDDGDITANFYQTDDKSTYIFKLVCAKHDDIVEIPLIDFSSGFEKKSMRTMGSIISDMYDYYVVNKYEDKNWKTDINGTPIKIGDEEYFEFEKFNGGWQNGGSYAYATDIDDFIKATVNENQYSGTLPPHGAGNNDTKIYFKSKEKDLSKNEVQSVYTCIDHKYYVYFPESDTLYTLRDAKIIKILESMKIR